MQQTAVYGEGDASYQAAGGIEGLRRLVADFYRLMDELPEATALRQLHGESLTLQATSWPVFSVAGSAGRRCSVSAMAHRYPAFNAQWPISEQLSQSWLDRMAQAIALQPWRRRAKEYLLAQLRVPAQRIVQASRTGTPQEPDQPG